MHEVRRKLPMNPWDIGDFEDCRSRIQRINTIADNCPYFLPDSKKEVIKVPASYIEDGIGKVGLTLTTVTNRQEDGHYAVGAKIDMQHPVYERISMETIPGSKDAWMTKFANKDEHLIFTPDVLAILQPALPEGNLFYNTLSNMDRIPSSINLIDSFRLDFADKSQEHQVTTIHRLPEDSFGVKRTLLAGTNLKNRAKGYRLDTAASYSTHEGEVTATISHFGNNMNTLPPNSEVSLASSTVGISLLGRLADYEQRDTLKALNAMLGTVALFEQRIEAARADLSL